MSTAPAKSTSRPSFAAFRYPSFRWFTLAGMLWMMADNIEHVISYWVLYEKFESPLLAGYAVVSHWAPFLLFGVIMGALADRYDCRKLCLISMGLFMSVSLAWGYLFLTDTTEIWHSVLLLTLHGIAGSIFMPASQLIVHDIVGNKDLQSGVRLTATSRQIGILLGPAIGGALLLGLGSAWGIFANAFIYVPMMWWSLRQPYTGHTSEEPGTRPTPRIGLGSAWQVIKETSANRTVMAMILLVGITSLLVGNAYHAQMPAFARSFLSENAGFIYTALLAANAAGAVFGGLVLESFSALQPEPRKAMVMAGLWALCIVVFAIAPHYSIALGALFVAGILQIGFTSMATTLVQLAAPPAKRGQVIGVFSMSMNGLRMGSGITVGFLGALVGIRWSLGVSATILVLATVVLFFYVRSQRNILAPVGRLSTLSADEAQGHLHDHVGGCC